MRVSGRQVLVDGKPFHMKGMNWNPIPWNGKHPANLDYAAWVEMDGDLMAKAGVNAIRTYEPLTDVAVLDALWERGIWVLNTVYGHGSTPVESAVEVVRQVKNHPAILMWVIGNEWNYNGIYAGLSRDQSIARINQVAALVKAEDWAHPLSTIYGGVPSSGTIYQMADIDIWGLNVYTGKSFHGMFNTWRERSGMPMYLGEYGADAFNTNIYREDQRAQAEATAALTEEIAAQSSATGGACLGGLLFEWSDEWWKDGSGSPAEHDRHGIAPGGGPYPDATFNEEWWGIVDINRAPRLAYEAFAAVSNPAAPDGPERRRRQPAPPVEGVGPACTPGQVQRRRRADEMCACRRRSGAEGSGAGWTCRQSAVVWEE